MGAAIFFLNSPVQWHFTSHGRGVMWNESAEACRVLSSIWDCLSLISWRYARKSSTGYQSRKYVDWACAKALKHGTITVSVFGYFHKNRRFLWEKNVSKTNLGSTIHYVFTSYNKYFRLCMVSEELRLNEIGLFRVLGEEVSAMLFSSV